MKILVADDEISTRRLLQLMLEPYGHCDTVGNGHEAVAAFSAAHAEGRPYDLVCLDIMMPELDGQSALKAMRRHEEALGIAGEGAAKIVMVSCLDSPNAVIEAYYKGGCSSYLVKPVRKDKLLGMLRELELLEK